MNIHIGIPTALLLLSVVACHTTSTISRTTSADNALLLEVSTAEREKIEAARLGLDAANDGYAASQSDHLRAIEAHSMLVQANADANAKLDRARTTADRASASGTASEVETAQTNLLRAQRDCGVQDAKIALGDKEVVHSKAVVALAREHTLVATAQVELTKARAINTLARPAGQKPVVSEFETSLRMAENSESVARIRAEAAKREVSIAANALRERQAVIGAGL